MPAIYACVIKPLLGWLRAEVVRWCEAQGVKDPAEVALGAVMDDALSEQMCSGGSIARRPTALRAVHQD